MSEATEESRCRSESNLEAIRWQLTLAVVERFPDAEFQWITLEGPYSLEVRVRLADYIWSYRFDRTKTLDAPDLAVRFAVAHFIAPYRNRPAAAYF